MATKDDDSLKRKHDETAPAPDQKEKRQCTRDKCTTCNQVKDITARYRNPDKWKISLCATCHERNSKREFPLMELTLGMDWRSARGDTVHQLKKEVMKILEKKLKETLRRIDEAVGTWHGHLKVCDEQLELVRKNQAHDYEKAVEELSQAHGKLSEILSNVENI